MPENYNGFTQKAQRTAHSPLGLLEEKFEAQGIAPALVVPSLPTLRKATSSPEKAFALLTSQGHVKDALRISAEVARR